MDFGLILSAITAATGLGGSLGLFGGGGGGEFDDLINQILAGEAGGIPPELMEQLLSKSEADITGFAGGLKESATADLNTRNLFGSGIEQNAFRKIDKDAISAFGDVSLGLNLTDATMRNQLLSQLLGMGNPNAAQNQAWGNLFGQGLGSLLDSDFSWLGGGAKPPAAD